MVFRQQSSECADAAEKVIPGGVNSPVRAFKAVGGKPVFISRAFGSKVEDVDGNQYTDYIGSWGPAILGHAHPRVVQKVQAVCENGLSFGAPTSAETELAEKICSAIPVVEKVRLVSSGTEACMSAIRLARAHTGREKIIKFSGHYHGHSDSLLIAAGSGLTTLSIPGSKGVCQGAVADTLVAQFNDIQSVKQHFLGYSEQIAGVIVEPIGGNCNFLRPHPGFLEELQDLCRQFGALLILDEVMTGFRIGFGGYSAKYGLKPDIVTLGKVVGGGMPLAAYGGSLKVMDEVAPCGGMYQAGTLSGNPLATAAGLETLSILESDLEANYARLSELSQLLTKGLSEVMATANIPFSVDFEGGMFGFCFRSQMPGNDLEAAEYSDKLFTLFFNRMLDLGHYFAPSAFEAGFLSLAHTPEDIQKTIEAASLVAGELCQAMKEDGGCC